MMQAVFGISFPAVDCCLGGGGKRTACDTCCASQKVRKKRLKANVCNRILSGSPQLPVQGKGRRQCGVFTFSHGKRRRCLTQDSPEILIMK